jgi:hypothetical protein
MKLVGLVTAGNSSDVLAGCIEHHRGLGVDAFAIVHIHSDDDTPEQIRALSRLPYVEALFPPIEEILSGRVMGNTLDFIRASMAPDWIVYIDSDERWLSRGRSLKQQLAEVNRDAVVAPRYNVVWPTPELAQDSGRSPVHADDLPIAAFPIGLEAGGRQDLDDVPWVLTRILPKCCIRADPTISFHAGGHWAIDRATGARISDEGLPELMVAQLAFTTRDRFEHKARFLQSMRATYARQVDASSHWGWHWERLARLTEADVGALETEWRRQFLSAAEAEALVGREVIVGAAEAFGL